MEKLKESPGGLCGIYFDKQSNHYIVIVEYEHKKYIYKDKTIAYNQYMKKERITYETK